MTLSRVKGDAVSNYFRTTGARQDCPSQTGRMVASLTCGLWYPLPTELKMYAPDFFLFLRMYLILPMPLEQAEILSRYLGLSIFHLKACLFLSPKYRFCLNHFPGSKPTNSASCEALALRTEFQPYGLMTQGWSRWWFIRWRTCLKLRAAGGTSVSLCILRNDAACRAKSASPPLSPPLPVLQRRELNGTVSRQHMSKKDNDLH